MNFDDIRKAWQSPLNRSSAAELQKAKLNFITDLRRRRRGNLLFLALVLGLLLFLTGLLGSHLLWPQPGTKEVDLAREWAVLPFFALPWLGWLYLVHAHCRHHAGHRHYDHSIRAGLSALLDENQSQIRRYKFIGILLVISALLLPLIVSQLQEVGKAGDEILVPALVIFPTYVAGVLIWSAVYYRRRLLPRKRQLEESLTMYGEAEAGPVSASPR